MADAIDFHGLLFVEPGERHANLMARDPIDIYARCAAACARSVVAQGLAFRLITNDIATLSARYHAMRLPAPIMVEHDFTLVVPPIPFRSAHHKLELFRAFATGRFGPVPALIDIDTILLRPLLVGIDPGVLYGYDITDQVAPAYGSDRLARDVTAVAGFTPGVTRWWGGEFLLGDCQAFGALADAVDALWPRYLGAVEQLHHLGDEMVTTAAIALLEQAGHRVADLGGAGVQRWWSARTRAPQATTLRQALTTALLHLPADKPLLAGYADPAHALAGFARRYRAHVRSKLPLRRLLSLGEQLLRRPRRFVPRLG